MIAKITADYGEILEARGLKQIGADTSIEFAEGLTDEFTLTVLKLNEETGKESSILFLEISAKNALYLAHSIIKMVELNQPNITNKKLNKN